MWVSCDVGEEDQEHLSCPQHVQPGRDPAMSDSGVLVSRGGPGQYTTGPYHWHCEGRG